MSALATAAGDDGDPPMQVLHAIHSGGFYGAERVVLDLMGQQRAAGHVMPALLDFVDPGQLESTLGQRLRERGDTVHRFQAPRGARPAALHAYARRLRELAPTVVHSHGYKPTLFHVVTRLLGLHAVPLVVSAHGYSLTSPSLRDQVYRLLDIWMLARADAVVAVSGEMHGYLERRSPRARIRTIPNGIDTSVVRAQGNALDPFLQARGVARGGDRPPVIGAVGRLVPMKNHAALITAVAHLWRDHPCVPVILGDGPLRNALEGQWKAELPELPPILIPHQPDVLDWMGGFDVFCMPSGPGEGLPMALLEAGLLGKAVVCSDSGGIGDLVQDGVTGLLVPMGDQPALERALATALSDAGLRTRLGAALRQAILDRHDIQACERAYAVVYRSAMGGETSG